MSADNYYIKGPTRKQLEEDENIVFETIKDGRTIMGLKGDDGKLTYGTEPCFTHSDETEDEFLYYGMFGTSGGPLAKYLFDTYGTLWHEFEGEDILCKTSSIMGHVFEYLVYFVSINEMIDYHVIDSIPDQEKYDIGKKVYEKYEEFGEISMLICNYLRKNFDNYEQKPIIENNLANDDNDDNDFPF